LGVALVDVILGYDCNLACDYCTITPEMRLRSLTTRAVLEALDEGRARGYDCVSFTGGEPTIRADLLGLVKAARARGYGDIKVQSNGLIYATASNVDKLVAAGANRFHVSIHTHDPAAYDELVRRDGSYPLMVAGLRNLVAQKLRVTADVILKTDTYRRLPDAIRWLHELGVRSAHLWFVSLTDGNRENISSMPRMTEVVPFMREAFAWARVRDFELRSLHVPRCLLGDDAPHAYDPGADRVLVVTPEARFELRDSKLAGSVHVEACRGCVHETICPGVRPDYLARYGDGEIAAARGKMPHHLPVV
jgi:MoaA/NifB/PqqE/SkfB family radical SAM enzyme